MPKLKDTRKRYSSPQNGSYTKKADAGLSYTRKLINKCSQENKLAKSTNTPPFDDCSEINTRSLLKKEKKTTSKPDIIREHLMPSLADLEKMFEDSENSQQLPLTTSITSEKGEKFQLIQKSNADDMLSSIDKTINENDIMLNESSTLNKNTTELEPVNRNSNSQIKKAFDNKPLSVAIPSKTCKTNHNISKIMDCQKPAQMKTPTDLSNDENNHVNNTGTSRRHHRMSRDSADSTKAVINEYESLPLPSTSRNNSTFTDGFIDSLSRYGLDSPNVPVNSKENLLSKIIRDVLCDVIENGTFDKYCLCFKIKLLLDIVQYESRNNPTNPSVSEREVNSGEMSNSQINLGNCPICMDDRTNRLAVSTFCGHIFCLECITQAINANDQKCPTCRKGLIYSGYHSLFL